MWLNFKAKGVVFMLLIAFTANAQQSKVVYNLRQNWVEYNTDSKGYLPVVSSTPKEIISFDLDCNQFKGKKLFVYVNGSSGRIFYNNSLIVKLSAKANYIDIDSLSQRLGKEQVFLTIYRSVPRTGILTYVVETGYTYELATGSEQQLRTPKFTSYFIIVSILLYVGLAIIKLRYPELFNQYGSFQRTFNPQTIDELIYKGRFFAVPGVIMVIWMSLALGFVVTYLGNKLELAGMISDIMSTSLISSSVLSWLSLSLIFFIIFLLRYALVTGVAAVFDMTNIRNIHFANLLRLTYYLLIVLLVAITLDYFSVFNLGDTFILWLIFGALFIIIILVGIRLSLIIRHTFVHLFLYLCATEIFLFAFVYKLVVG